MNRFISGLLIASVLVGAAFLAFTSEPVRPAFACSGPPTHWQMAGSPLVVAGRIVSAEEDVAARDQTYHWFRLAIEVEQGFRGAKAGQRLEVAARVPGPVPVMCPQFEREETFVGKFVVAGLAAGDGATPEFYRWGTAYLGHDRDGQEYHDAIRVARIATGGDADLPSLSVTVPGVCAGIAHIRGSRFEPGQTLLLNYPLDPPESGVFVRPTVVTDSTGAFTHSFRLPRDWCPIDWFVEAYADDYAGQIGGWPLAIAPVRADEAAAPLPPDVGNSPPAALLAKEPSARTWVIGAICGLGLAAAASMRFRR